MTTLHAPHHLPPACSTALAHVPLADLADALAARLDTTLVDIDPRDRQHLHQLRTSLTNALVPPCWASVAGLVVKETTI